ncbi:hypothetical protein RJ640_007040, partial [Escallonia rubra]
MRRLTPDDNGAAIVHTYNDINADVALPNQQTLDYPSFKLVQLSELEIRQLCLRSKDIFLQQPNLLELEAPIKIC